MSNGLGAGFFALTLLAALGGLAVVAGVIGLAAAVRRRQAGTVPNALRFGSAGLLVVVATVAGFGVAALVDEAPVGAALLVAAVFAPLAGVAVDRRGLDPVDRAATAVTAWGGPYLGAVVVFVGVNALVARYADLAPAEARAAGVGWFAVALGGAVAVAGAVALGRPLGRVLAKG